MREVKIHQITPHPKQELFKLSPAKRKVIRAGRRSGKTTGIADLAVDLFLEGKRVLYAAPTAEQIDRFWTEVVLALQEAIDAKIFTKNETRHIIELPGTEQRIRAKTAWNADSLRGDYADVLILDEWQLMSEDTWERVGAPMLLDNNGDAIFIYTPPSARSRSVSKAHDHKHAAKMFKRAENDDSGRWEAFHFTSHDNPHISKEALKEIAKDMTPLAYKMEIEALDIAYVPGALWTPDICDAARWDSTRNGRPHPYRIVVGVDPHASSGQTGVVVAGVFKFYGRRLGIVLEDNTSEKGDLPSAWAKCAIDAYHRWEADVMVGEVNNGGDMIEHVIKSVAGGERVNYKSVRATRGKHTRAEPISALFNPPPAIEEGLRAYFLGEFPELEEELCSWVPGDASPNRLDAMVWALTELDLNAPNMDDLDDIGEVEGFKSRYS